MKSYSKTEVNKSLEYYLGIDGGGTKTEFLLTDKNHNEINRLYLGCANPVNNGIENTFSVLGDGIRKVCNGIELVKVAVFAGIAGLKNGDNELLLSNFLSDFGFFSFGCGSDTELALELALNGKNGTAVIMGTGITALSRNDEKLYRSGGRGYLIDKGGSGFHLGSDALNSAFEFLDGRGGSEIMLKLAEKKLGMPLEDCMPEIYKGGVSYIASFAPVVFEAYTLGDSEASEIIERNAREAARVINGALKISGNTDKKAVICGGLCKQKEVLYPFIKKHLVDGATLEFKDEPMVNAAILLAKRLSGE